MAPTPLWSLTDGQERFLADVLRRRRRISRPSELSIDMGTWWRLMNHDDLVNLAASCLAVAEWNEEEGGERGARDL